MVLIFYRTYGTKEFPDGSLIVRRAIIGGVNGRRDKLAIPNSAVRSGCCTISSSYDLYRPSEWAKKLADLETTYRALLKGSTNKEATRIRGWVRVNEWKDEAGKSVVDF